MNISILSTHSSYHHLAQAISADGHNVFHYGANSILKDTATYHPRCFNFPLSGVISDDEIQPILDDINKTKNGFVIASGIPIPRIKSLHNFLKLQEIPYFFVDPEFTNLEIDKSKTKKMLEHLKIPTPEATSVDGKYLFENFQSLERPFVVKLNYVFHYGKQTIVVNDENFNDVYNDLFSIHLGESPRITNIGFNTKITLEKFIKLKREYSYHLVSNLTGWRYIGSARDYKQNLENDLGFNTIGMGAYNTDNISTGVHDYAEKIINFLKNYLKIEYKGFMFIGVGVDENNNHIVLEINTRSGDPELQVILNSIDNNLAELFYLCSTNSPIPEIMFNQKKSVTVRLLNKVFDWTHPARYKPNLDPCPTEIVHSLEGGSDFYMSHSVFTSSSLSIEDSSKVIYDYLPNQHLGQFYYRKDIGILV